MFFGVKKKNDNDNIRKLRVSDEFSVSMTSDVYMKIKKTIGSIQGCESGGILLSSDGEIIDDFVFDEGADTTATSYSPDVRFLNKALAEANAKGYALVGFIHSHPSSFRVLSDADKRYSADIMKALNLDKNILPIITHDNSGNMRMNTYIHFRGGRIVVAECKIVESRVVNEVDNNSSDNTERFSRIEPAINLEVMKNKTIVCVGCGGASGLILDLARCGVGRFVLIDHDVYAHSNVSNQFATESNIGAPKVESLKAKLLDINPNIKVVANKVRLDDDVFDTKLERIVGDKLKENSEDVLICGFTDDFSAQKRTAALAMKYGTPYIAAQLYANGDGAEVCFTYPGVTASCPRCMLESRYKAYANGYRNDVTSSCSTIFSTERVNSICGQIILGLLQYEAKGSRYANFIDSVKDRNFVQLKLTPFGDERLMPIFEDYKGVDTFFFDTAAWIEQTPNHNCPLCGGTGNLLDKIGRIRDTRSE